MKEKQTYREPAIIDVDGIFKKKSPHIYRFLPRFVINYIKRTIHQEELNKALIEFKDKEGLDFISNVLDYYGIKYTVSGEENIPREGRHIFVSNHPLGGLDGMIFLDIIGKYHKNVKFIVNDLLLNLKNLEPVFVPVNKHGRQSTEYVRKIEELYKSDNQVLYFPAGLCSRKQGDRIMDLEWKKNFIKKAVDYKRDIVPVHFEGHNSRFFYGLANLRQKLGIKTNIEMFYLPDEMFRQRHQKIHVTIGKPLPLSHIDKSKSLSEWAQEIKNRVYTLADNR